MLYHLPCILYCTSWHCQGALKGPLSWEAVSSVVADGGPACPCQVWACCHPIVPEAEPPARNTYSNVSNPDFPMLLGILPVCIENLAHRIYNATDVS